MLFKMLSFIIFFLVSLHSYGKTYLDKTRVIINEIDNEETVNIRNVDASPILLQIWIDNGNMNEDVLTTKTPFLITNPIVKVLGGNNHQIRILSIDNSGLPTDKESIFWLNVLEIKEKQRDGTEDKVNIAFRTRIKLFYRPASINQLAGQDMKKKLTFQLLDDKGNTNIKVNNPTPIYQTFSFASKKNERNLINGNDMVAPFSSVTWSVTDDIKKGDTIDFLTINDSGVEDIGSSVIN